MVLKWSDRKVDAANVLGIGSEGVCWCVRGTDSITTGMNVRLMRLAVLISMLLISSW
jgi:hypothetical protein